MSIKSPILISSDKEDIVRFGGFIEQLRKMGAAEAARHEIKRLQPYLNALSEKLQEDLRSAELQSDDRMQALFEPAGLSRLFNAIARHTGSTVLSEMAIVPERVLALAHQGGFGDATSLRGQTPHNGARFSLGFIQVLGVKAKNNVSLPLFAFDDRLMKAVAAFEPEKMLAAFQIVVGAGNHDMLHHYSNRSLNPAIAIVTQPRGVPKVARRDGVEGWYSKYFKAHPDEKNEESYESWLMLTQAKVRKRMENRSEGRKLRSAADVFFDELGRIGAAIDAAHGKEAGHKAADYFGSMLCFAMMRFMPLDHPLVLHAINRLKAADPAPEILIARRESILKSIKRSKSPHVSEAIAFCKLEGALTSQDYYSLKKLELVMILPWVARLMAKAPPGSSLAIVKSRADAVAHHMFNAAAADSWFEPRASAFVETNNIAPPPNKRWFWPFGRK